MTTTRWLLTRFGALLAVIAIAGAVVMYIHRAPQAKTAMTDVDIGFAQDMSVHHQQAVTLADMLAADVDSDIRALGDQIRTKQLYEIGQMTGWLQAADAPQVAKHPMAWMNAHTGQTDADQHDAATHAHAMSDDPTMTANTMLMPGMATRADLARLERLKGRDNEVLFLQLMDRHHHGGIDMSKYAFDHTKTAFVRQTALVMAREQGEECALMTSMVARLHGSPLPYP